MDPGEQMIDSTRKIQTNDTEPEEEDGDLFEINLEIVDKIPPTQYYSGSNDFSVTGNTLLANCLLPIADVSRAVPVALEERAQVAAVERPAAMERAVVVVERAASVREQPEPLMGQTGGMQTGGAGQHIPTVARLLGGGSHRRDEPEESMDPGEQMIDSLRKIQTNDTEPEEEDGDLFEINLEIVDKIPPTQYYSGSNDFSATGNTLLANCLLPIADVSRAVPVVM
ncbi:Unknown protein [Striga hermonthica]|uniref:Uncharacterized protein n=1 Tax=Striga hermonthica TaxID=68872 RepID=A0A9N7RMF9_STRHE|nr:Unknown protein [Striga hermonthica]